MQQCRCRLPMAVLVKEAAMDRPQLRFSMLVVRMFRMVQTPRPQQLRPTTRMGMSESQRAVLRPLR